MVKEFPTLQGVMGAEYARRDGEPAEVVQALREQYAPRTAQDPIPASETGTWLSLLDRADTLTGFFGIGLSPTSSEDPYGLRRQALGLVRILIEKPLALSLDRLLHTALQSWGSRLTVPEVACLAQLQTFLLDRFRWWACEVWGAPREVVDAVLAAPADDLANAAQRVRALYVLWQDPQQREAVLFTAGKVQERTGRIVQSVKEADAIATTVDPAKFTALAERELWKAWTAVKATTDGLIQQGAYAQSAAEYGKLYPQLNQFFEKVFVMDKDPMVRANRLALMKDIYFLYANSVGDLSKLPLPTEVATR